MVVSGVLIGGFEPSETSLTGPSGNIVDRFLR
jgi:hypothetical protein